MANNYYVKRNTNIIRGDFPTIEKERIYYKKKLYTNRTTNITYWMTTNDLKQKFSRYLYACNKDQCLVMKQRLATHIRDHHSDSLANTLSISPKQKTVRSLKRNSKSSNSTQTLNLQDQSEGTENKTLRKTYVLRDPRLYKIDLDKTIMKWIQHVPIYQYTSDKKVVADAINSLINNINDLANNIKDVDYEKYVKLEIDTFLNTPGMWYPNDNEDDKVLMKESLNNYLWKSITEINDKYFANNRGDDNITMNNCKGRNQARKVCSKNKNCSVTFSMNESKDEVEIEIRKWLNELKQTHKVNARINIKETVQLFLTRLADLLDQQKNVTAYKTVLKSEIVNILDELRICSCNPDNQRNIDIDKFAEDFTNKLVKILARNKSFRNRTSNTDIYKRNNIRILNFETEFRANDDLKHTLQDVVNEYLGNRDICSDIVEHTLDLLIKNIDCFKTNKDSFVKAEISNLLRGSCDVSIVDASNIAQHIVDIATEVVSQDNTVVSNTGLVRPCLSRVVSVYAISKPSSRPVTSTPKAKNAKTKKDISKLNPEEKSYSEKVINLIRAWINTLPKQFHTPEDQNFKEVIIDELVGNILEETKLAQLVPYAISDQRRFISYLIHQWLQKFEICSEFDALTEQTDLLVEKILTIPVPVLTRPQPTATLPNTSDILEDEISTWMNEQPSDIYTTKYNDNSTRSKMVQELASKVRKSLTNKRPHKEISQQVAQWLSKIVQPGQKNNVKQLSENLKDRIIKLPQDQTLAAEKAKLKRKSDERIQKKLSGPPPPVPTKTSISKPDDTENTLKEFIEKYIEHNYDIDDPLARGAFTNLLKSEIIRLNPPTRKEVYDNFMKAGQRDYFSTERLDKELQYIKIVSDWLNIVPFVPDCIVGNKIRVKLINSFAKEIYDIEHRRIKAPDEMDHDAYLESIIYIFLFELPIDKEKINDQLFKEFMDKIIATRPTNQSQLCCKAPATSTKIYGKSEIASFIEDYFEENSRVLDDNEVKMEACSARLLKEVKQIVQDTANPEILSKEKVYENLNQLPVSGDESVKRFNLELDYAKEITEWMKNLPLLPILNQPESQEASMNMISTLAEKIVGRHYKKAANPMDTQADDELVDFVNKWISQLPVDLQKEIVYPVVISQLMNRIKKVDMKLKGEQTNMEKIQDKINKSINENKNSPKTPLNGTNPKANNHSPGKTGEVLLVDAIEQWSNSLPIKSANDIETKAIKDNVAKNLYQKVGELNANPRTYNDDLLFQEIIADEIDNQLENIPQNTELQNNRQQLKAKLLEAVMEAKKITKKTSAGDNYKHKLEKTIESSIPYPVRNQIHDPEFEIYKKRLAEEFILENFDYGNDAVKINYEKRIKNEIDKYFRSAQNRNAIPLTKDQIYNQLYSSLFKVPIPNQNSIIEEVEEVKTKCEIEKWFQKLPLRPATGAEELLEWDKIVSMLAKRMHEIENSESEPDEKIHKEITKWLLQLPLLPGQQSNVDQLANNLQALLKSTTKSRKFVPMPLVQPKTNVKNMDKVNKDRSYGVSQMEWPSRAGRKWISSSNIFGQSSCHTPPTPRKKNSAEIIHTIVKSWCDDLPIRGNTIQEQVDVYNFLDDLKGRIILKISELNSSPAVLNDDIVYNELIDDAIETLFSTLPSNNELQQTKKTRKLQLIQGIQWVRPLVIEEKARHEYKNELNETVSNILGSSLDSTANIAVNFNKIKDEIVENFVEYNYNKDDEEGKQAYKMLIHDAVVKYFSEIVENWDNPSDILMKRNELICELSKIPIPNTAVLKQEVEEIRMKNEVRDFFNQLSLPEESEENMALRDQVKTNLAKMLNDIEKGGHNCSNDHKMREEISRCLNKLKLEVDPEVISAFVNKLKNDETERKAPPPSKDTATVSSPCQAVQGSVPLCARAALPCNFTGSNPGSNTGEVMNSSVGQFYGTAQQIPVVTDGSVHRSLLNRSALAQPVQFPANEMVIPQILLPPCPQIVPEAIPQVTSGQLLNTVQSSRFGQRTGTVPTTNLYRRQPMAQAPESVMRPRGTRTGDTRPSEMRPGTCRSGRPGSGPSSEEDEKCICESRRRPRNRRNRPPCYYPRDYCDDCEVMMPPWWGDGGCMFSNDQKMKKDTVRCLKLLNIEANPEEINGYLNKPDVLPSSDCVQANVNILSCQHLTVPTSSPCTPTTGLFERQSMAQAPQSERLGETRQACREVRPRSKFSSEEDDEDRYNTRRRLRNRKRSPFYYPKYYCDDCDDYEDMMFPWWGMPHPGLFY